MRHGAYTCNICRYQIESAVSGDINAITLSLDGPSYAPGETIFTQNSPDAGSVHICGRCCVGLISAFKDLKITMFAMVER